MYPAVHEILKLFLDTKVIDLLVKQTFNYASQSENYQFTLSHKEIKVCIVILLLSGYCRVPHREPDTNNEMVLSLMWCYKF